jgi:type IV secretion system protein VirD4
VIRELIATLITVWGLDLAAAAALAAAVVFYLAVISKKAAGRNRPRALRWRIRLKLHPGPGYASSVELLVRWSRLAAFFHGRRARPGLTCADRLTRRTTEYAVRLGRAQYGRRVFARLEDQVLVLAPQRVGKSGVIADRIVDHPGAVLATSTKADLFSTTGADRAMLGRVHVFNPQAVGNVASTLRWDMIGPCRDLAMARRIASWLSGGAKGNGHGNIEWFEQKGEVALAGLLHAAALTGATISDVFRWVQLDDHQTALKALAEMGTPEILAVVRRMLADNRTAGSVRDTIELSLAWAAIPALAEAVTPRHAGEIFDVENFVLGRGTLYMIASGDDDSPVTPLFRALASFVHYQAGLIGTRTRAGRLDPPLLMALDEVAVICPIDLPAMLADAAGKGILIMPVVHSTSQLEGRWGKDGGETIWSTCGTKLLLPGISHAQTLEDVSKLCGTVTEGTPPNDRTVRVVPPELLRTLPDWHALVVRMNLNPVVVKVRPVWKRPERRFPRSYLRPRPVLTALPSLPLPITEPVIPVTPAEVDWPAAEFLDPVPALPPLDGTRPWDGDGSTDA